MSAAAKRIVKSIRTTRFASCIAVGVLVTPLTAAANDFNAEKVLNEMKSEQQYAYLAGVVEGLAFARYLNDGKQKTGMGCIYDWFYKDKQTLPTILDGFEKFPSYPPGSIIDALVKQKCGE